MLYRRGKVWWYRIKFHSSEVRESAGTRSKTVAKRIEFHRRRELEEGAGGIRRRKPQLFRAASEAWLAVKKPTLAPKTVAAETSNLKHLIPFFGGMLCSDIEPADVARYQEARRRQKAAAGTVNLEVSTLRAILRRLGLWARLQPEVSMFPEREDVGRAISVEEESRLLRACGGSMSRSLLTAVLVALNTGLRYGELAGLRWEQVDLIRRRLTVGKSKTAAGTCRTIPLNDRALAALSMQASRFPDCRPEHFVFPSERYKKLPDGQGSCAYALNPERPITDLSAAWDAAKRRTKDEANSLPVVVCRWHDLRHTFLTRLIEAGTPFPRLAVIMGWSAATTARMSKRYGHVSTDALREDLAALDRAGIAAKGAQKGAQSAPEFSVLPS